jgi:predicted amidohydrolase
MRDIRSAAAQFEHKNADRDYNFSRIDALTADAVRRGAEVVSFHECSITGYTFLRRLSRDELFSLAEAVPEGPSTERLATISRRHGIPVLAGLLERAGDRVFNTYVCVSPDGFVARHRKMHAFVNPNLSSGDAFTVFDLAGCQCGILTCYDNNLVENVRITALLGAEIIFMPHVTGCLPSAMPGRGLVDPELWHNRDRDPVPLMQEFDGPKGRGWLMRWLPARAYDNGVYAVFTNPIGMDDDQVRNGNAMILDPFGEILAECTSMGDEVAVALCTGDKFEKSSGYRFRRARRPDLYAKLVEPSAEPPVTRPGWDLRPNK